MLPDLSFSVNIPVLQLQYWPLIVIALAVLFIYWIWQFIIGIVQGG